MSGGIMDSKKPQILKITFEIPLFKKSVYESLESYLEPLRIIVQSMNTKKGPTKFRTELNGIPMEHKVAMLRITKAFMDEKYE